jgi:hypothetical protein
MTKARDIASAAPAPSTVSATEIGYLDGVSSAIQTQIDGKSGTSHNHDSTYVAKSLVDAKGDLLVGTANDTISRLAVASTAGYLLTVDSAEATGLKWAAAASNTLPAFRATNNASQSISAQTWTKVTFQTETFDTDNCFASSRFTPTTAGYYQINVTMRTDGNSQDRFFAIYKNGSSDTQWAQLSTTEANLSGSNLIYFNGSSDYVEVYVYTSGSSTIPNAQNVVSFSGVGIRS